MTEIFAAAANETSEPAPKGIPDFAISEATQFGLADQLVVRGWAAEPQRVSSVRVTVDGHRVGATRLNVERADVAAKLGHDTRPAHGFFLAERCAATALAGRFVEVTFLGRDGKPLATLRRKIVQSHRLDLVDAVYDHISRQLRIRGCFFPTEQLRAIAIEFGSDNAHRIRNIFQFRRDGLASDPRRRTLYSGFEDRISFVGESDLRKAQLKFSFADGSSCVWKLPPDLVRMNAPDAAIEEIRLDWLRDHAEIRGWFRSYEPVSAIALMANGQPVHGIPVLTPSDRLQKALGYRGPMVQEFRVAGPLRTVLADPDALFSGEIEMGLELRSRDEVLLAERALHPRVERHWGAIGLMIHDRRNDVFHCSGSIAGPVQPATVQVSVNGRALDNPLPVDGCESAGRGFFSWTHTINGVLPPTGKVKLDFFDAAGAHIGALFEPVTNVMTVSRHGAVDGLSDAALAERLLDIHARVPRLQGASVCFVMQGSATGVGPGGGVRRMMDLMASFHDAGYTTVLVDRSEPWSALKWPQQYRALRRICDYHVMVPQAAKSAMFQKLGEVVKAGKFPLAADLRLGGKTLAEHLAEPPRRDGTEGLSIRVDPLFNTVAACLVNVSGARLAISCFAWSSGFQRLLLPSVHGMIDTIDVQSLRGAVFAEAQATFGAEAVPELAKYAVTLDEELAHLSAAGSIIAISPAEHAFLCRHIAPQKVVHAGMSARSTAALPPSSPDSRRVLFVGNSYEPNLEGIRTFLREVWPAILARIPEARLAICGRVAADLAVPDVAGVDLIGPVEDLADAYREAAVAVNPIRFGTGLSVKVIETLAMGRCMVSTPVGGRGFETAAAAGALEIVGLDDFADRICTLLLDPAARAAMEAAALDYARRALAPEVVHADLFNLVESRLFY